MDIADMQVQVLKKLTYTEYLSVWQNSQQADVLTYGQFVEKKSALIAAWKSSNQDAIRALESELALVSAQMFVSNHKEYST